MTYMRFTPIARNIWEVSTPVKSYRLPSHDLEEARAIQCRVQ